MIVLLSDGKNTSGTRDPIEIAREAGRARIPIYAIALGTPAGEVELRDSFGFLQRVQVPPDTETLKEIARLSGGKSYTATETDKVKEIYANLGTRLSSTQREARGHRGVRRRRDRAADRRRQPLAALVRPADLTLDRTPSRVVGLAGTSRGLGASRVRGGQGR